MNRYDRLLHIYSILSGSLESTVYASNLRSAVPRLSRRAKRRITTHARRTRGSHMWDQVGGKYITWVLLEKGRCMPYTVQ
eukprot:COSAG02_NODE_414_length_22826_cov_9.001364_3_plen_80_part_00